MLEMRKVSELTLGDKLKCFDGPFGTGIVKQIVGNTVTVFRPYGTTADFTYTGGVICYTGIEEYSLFRDDSAPVPVYVKG